MILATFITITEGMMSSMLGYVSDLLTDLSPIFLLIIAVSLGLLVITTLVGAFRH